MRPANILWTMWEEKKTSPVNWCLASPSPRAVISVPATRVGLCHRQGATPGTRFSSSKARSIWFGWRWRSNRRGLLTFCKLASPNQLLTCEIRARAVWFSDRILVDLTRNAKACTWSDDDCLSACTSEFWCALMSLSAIILIGHKMTLLKMFPYLLTSQDLLHFN